MTTYHYCKERLREYVAGALPPESKCDIDVTIARGIQSGAFSRAEWHQVREYLTGKRQYDESLHHIFAYIANHDIGTDTTWANAIAHRYAHRITVPNAAEIIISHLQGISLAHEF